MKKIKTTLLAVFTTFSFMFGQTQSSKTTKPQLKPGDKIKLSVGTSDNGNFKFIYTNSNELLKLPKIYLDASFSNLSVQILGIEKVGNERLGFKTMLTVWIDEDSIPTSAKKAYSDFCIKADELLQTMQNDLKNLQSEYTASEKYYSDVIKSLRKKQIEDSEKNISDYKADLEIKKVQLIKEMNSIRWIVDLEAATTAGEVKK